MSTTKRCSKCGETKPVTEFGRYAKAKDGLHPHCKTCVNARARARQRERRAIPANYVKELDARAIERYPNTHYPADREARLTIYRQARAMGPDFEVDHIVSLGGDLVRGLHVPHNLRIVTAAENGAKRHHFDPAHGLAITFANASYFAKQAPDHAKDFLPASVRSVLEGFSHANANHA